MAERAAVENFMTDERDGRRKGPEAWQRRTGEEDKKQRTRLMLDDAC